MIIALAYAEMLRYMGGVPLLKHSVAANEEMHYPRNTFAETVDYIVQLLDEAAPALEWKASDTDAGRMTKAGAMALKLRVLLFAGVPDFQFGDAVPCQSRCIFLLRELRSGTLGQGS